MQIKLSAGERVTAVEGTIGRFGGVPDVVITSLTFRTSTGRTYGPYGNRCGGGDAILCAGGGRRQHRRLLGTLRLASRCNWGLRQTRPAAGYTIQHQGPEEYEINYIYLA